MPLKAELDAVKKTYLKLLKLPVKDLLPALKKADIVTTDQREQIDAMTSDKDRAEYLLDTVIIATLKVDCQEHFYNFLRVLEDYDNAVVKQLGNDLRMHLKRLQPSMRSFSWPAEYYSPPYPEYPPRSLDGQQCSLQPNLLRQMSIPEEPSPVQPYPPQPPPRQQFYSGYNPEQPYSGQPNPGQYPMGQQLYSRSISVPVPVQPHPGLPYPGQEPNPQQQLYRSYSVQPNHTQSYVKQHNLVRQISEPGQPYPGVPGQPYPGVPGQPYPGVPGQPYPGVPGQPYPGVPGQPYPGVPGQPYPGVPGQPYHGVPGQPYLGVPGQPLVGHREEKQLIMQVEKILIKSSKRGIDALSANNRNFHAVCLIRREIAEGTEVGTGFIANLTMPNTSSPVTVLLTNHHVIHNLSEALEATYQFSYLRTDSDDNPEPIRGEDLILHNDQGFHTCVESDRGDDILLDYTLIQVHERPLNDTMIKSELDGERFPLSECKFDLDNPAMPSSITEMETVCVLHYPRGQPLKRSTQGSINADHLLFYYCDTDGGSSGGPVFKVVNKELKVIAVHRGSWQGIKFNFGTLITDILRHVMNGPAAKMNKWTILKNLAQRVKNYEEPVDK